MLPDPAPIFPIKRAQIHAVLIFCDFRECSGQLIFGCIAFAFKNIRSSLAFSSYRSSAILMTLDLAFPALGQGATVVGVRLEVWGG